MTDIGLYNPKWETIEIGEITVHFGDFGDFLTKINRFDEKNPSKSIITTKTIKPLVILADVF